MTREECIWWVNHLCEIRKEECFNRGMIEDAKEVQEAQHMAIEALKAEAVSRKAKCCPIAETCMSIDCPVSSEYIGRLSAEAVQRWIPCSERLPNYDGDRYLVTGYSQEKGGVVGISFCYLNKYGFWSDVPKGFQIIAWMPLPKPYREDGEA